MLARADCLEQVVYSETNGIAALALRLAAGGAQQAADQGAPPAVRGAEDRHAGLHREGGARHRVAARILVSRDHEDQQTEPDNGLPGLEEPHAGIRPGGTPFLRFIGHRLGQALNLFRQAV